MKSIAVIYQSKYGSSKQYAQWIAQALGGALFERSAMKPSHLKAYDVVVYGGGLYSGSIIGIDLVTKQPVNKLVVFATGLASPEMVDHTGIITRNLPPKLQSHVKLFYFRGAIDYGKLTPVHAGMMALRKRMIEKKAVKSEGDKAILQTYGSAVTFVDEEAIAPLVAYVKNIR